MAVDELTQRSCVLTWKAPEFDGGSPVTGYYVERRQGYTDRWIKVSQCSCTLACLLHVQMAGARASSVCA